MRVHGVINIVWAKLPARSTRWLMIIWPICKPRRPRSSIHCGSKRAGCHSLVCFWPAEMHGPTGRRQWFAAADASLHYCGTRDVVCNTINQRPSRFSYMLVVKAVKLTASPFLNFP